jgi:hypothetical protein
MAKPPRKIGKNGCGDAPNAAIFPDYFVIMPLNTLEIDRFLESVYGIQSEG